MHAFRVLSTQRYSKIRYIERQPVWRYSNLSVSAAQRVSSSHNGHQPASDGRLCGTFHEASGRFLSPAGDQRKGAPGQISATHSPLGLPLRFPLRLSLSTDRDRRERKASRWWFLTVQSFTSNPFILCLFCRVKQIRGVNAWEEKKKKFNNHKRGEKNSAGFRKVEQCRWRKRNDAWEANEFSLTQDVKESGLIFSSSAERSVTSGPTASSWLTVPAEAFCSRFVSLCSRFVSLCSRFVSQLLAFNHIQHSSSFWVVKGI